MLSDRELLQVHVEALFTRNASGRLVRVNEPNGKRAPRFFLGRTSDGNDWWFRDDLAEGVVQNLRVACARVPNRMEMQCPAGAAPFDAILGMESPIRNVWSGPAFRFQDLSAKGSLCVRVTPANAFVLKPHLASWSDNLEGSQPLYALLVDGHAVSVCASVRRTSIAHEAGVETAAAFRGNGYAMQVVRAWAEDVAHLGRLPLYSTSWTNLASRALACRLCLVQYASDLHIT
jgi:hypothetical protein